MNPDSTPPVIPIIGFAVLAVAFAWAGLWLLVAVAVAIPVMLRRHTTVDQYQRARAVAIVAAELTSNNGFDRSVGHVITAARASPEALARAAELVEVSDDVDGWSLPAERIRHARMSTRHYVTPNGEERRRVMELGFWAVLTLGCAIAISTLGEMWVPVAFVISWTGTASALAQLRRQRIWLPRETYFTAKGAGPNPTLHAATAIYLAGLADDAPTLEDARHLLEHLGALEPDQRSRASQLLEDAALVAADRRRSVIWPW